MWGICCGFDYFLNLKAAPGSWAHYTSAQNSLWYDLPCSAVVYSGTMYVSQERIPCSCQRWFMCHFLTHCIQVTVPNHIPPCIYTANYCLSEIKCLSKQDCPSPFIALVRVGNCQYIFNGHFPVLSCPRKSESESQTELTVTAAVHLLKPRAALLSLRPGKGKDVHFFVCQWQHPKNCKLHPFLPSMNCRQHPIQFAESVNGFLFVKSVNSISVAWM